MDGQLCDRNEPKNWMKRAAWTIRRRIEAKAEQKGWLPPYRRLVVVCGMARTGTSALAAYVASHPDVRLVVGGPLWHRLESDYVRTKVDWAFIDGVLEEFCPNKVLLKQPWLETNVGFFDKARGAKVLVCTRGAEALFGSWRSTEFVGDECKRRPMEAYVRGMFCCLRLMMRGAMEVRQEGMTPELAKPLGKFLGVRPEGFDGERIKTKWTGPQNREWIEARAVWRDKR